MAKQGKKKPVGIKKKPTGKSDKPISK